MKNQPKVEDVIAKLGLLVHPEGGFFRETYRSGGQIPASALPSVFQGARTYSTSILYLLPEGRKSGLHRIKQDEVWHYHLGGPLRLFMISPQGETEEIILGPDIMAGQHLQFTVPAGYWFGAKPRPGAGYCLVGCTVAPGFEFADFEMASEAELKKAFPALYGVISEFS